ncbi:hypothetical protein AVEN_92941-1 [Araneus ventricosus]|uniref:Cuticle protein 16.8 n=1 Tax=Araneus ventricosus TaxID=182803 RepID=A0A4Y2NC82_ARAVE|nr:hypothetical protein AVEN_92941-1 [Araneus ventricosus]
MFLNAALTHRSENESIPLNAPASVLFNKIGRLYPKFKNSVTPKTLSGYEYAVLGGYGSLGYGLGNGLLAGLGYARYGYYINFCHAFVLLTLSPARLHLDCSENVDEEAVEQRIKEDSTLVRCEVLSDNIVSRVTCGSEEIKTFEECPASDEENLPIHHPQPFKFGYSIKDKHGEQHREEVGDGKNVKGSYGFTDARGIHRQVNYVADHGGFRAQVKTNEPGTANQNPAAVHIISDAPYGHGGYAGAAGLGYAGGVGAGYGYGGVGETRLGYGYGGVGAAGLGYGSAGVGGYGDNFSLDID